MISTFPVIHTAGSLYDGEAMPYFRTGTPPPPGGTVHLNGYHCYRSLLWPDAGAIAAALEGRRVTAVGFACESCGDALESAEDCRVRLYRTDLGYDPDKAGMNTADTTRFDAGMTAGQPRNAHMPEFFQTDPLPRGGADTGCTLARGAAARRLAEALKAGYALGGWELRPGETFFSDEKSYRVRMLRNMAVLIEHEADTGCVPPPDSAEPDRPRARAGTAARLIVKGLCGAGADDPVTGVYVSARDETATGPGPWSADTFYALEEGAEEAEVSVTAPEEPGVKRRFRAAARAVSGASVYVQARTLLTALPAPLKCAAELSAVCRLARIRVTLPEQPGQSGRVLCVNGEPEMLLDSSARRVTLTRLLDEGENTLVFTVRDFFGGESAETVLTARGENGRAPLFDVLVNGTPCSAFGAMLTALPDRPVPARRETRLQAAGKSGTVRVREEEDLFQDVTVSFELLCPGPAALNAVTALLSRADTLEFGDRPGLRYENVTCTELLPGTPGGAGGGTLLRVKARCGPGLFEKSVPALPLPGAGGAVVNTGDLTCRPVLHLAAEGDVALRVNGGPGLYVYAVSGGAVIDCETGRAYDPSSGRELPVSGEFPFLPRGKSTLTLEGNLFSARIRLRERRL